jgi:hypothetical protein
MHNNRDTLSIPCAYIMLFATYLIDIIVTAFLEDKAATGF